MLKKTNTKTKCAKIEYANAYESMSEGLTNPYCYNFGKVIKNKNNMDFIKIHHIVNNEFFYKK